MERHVISKWNKKKAGQKLVQVVYHTPVGTHKSGKRKIFRSETKHELVKAGD